MDKNLRFDRLFEEEWKPSSYFNQDPYQLKEFEKILRTMVVKKPPPVRDRWRRVEPKEVDEAFDQQEYLDEPDLCKPLAPEQRRTRTLAKVTEDNNTRQRKRKNGKAWVFKIESDENTEQESEPETQQEPEQEIEIEPQPDPEHTQIDDLDESFLTMVKKPKKIPNAWQQGNPWFRTAHKEEMPEPVSEPDPYSNWFRASVIKKRVQKRALSSQQKPSVEV